MTVLPEAVRAHVVALGSDVLGALADDEVPAPLRKIARFAAVKRARAGATAIAAAVESDAGFRRRVFAAAAEAHPGLADALGAGTPPPAADPADVATVAYLLRPDGWEQVIDDAAESVRQSEDDARQAREESAAVRVREQLDATRAAARESRERLKGEVDRLKSENTALRRRLQETRTRLAGSAEAEARAAADAEALERAENARRTAEAEVRRLRSRLGTLEETLEASRRAGREGRGLETARLALLLETLTDAAAGLRRELALPASSLRPADTVDAREAEPTGDAPRARGADDPSYVEELLGLPAVHLVVDGYNVTKTAWPSMPLEAQRSRLVQGLAALAARSGAEVTCVFDGADVSVRAAGALAQAVRVRFSPPGETADELIRQLVRAEPPGRPVIVVSSDREVATGVRRPGVRSVDAIALVGLLR